ATVSPTHFVRERHLVVSRERILEHHRRIVERTPREQAREQYLESLAQRVSKHTGLPIETARKQVEAVAASARKRHANSLASTPPAQAGLRPPSRRSRYRCC